jgi:hypothetical protein
MSSIRQLEKRTTPNQSSLCVTDHQHLYNRVWVHFEVWTLKCMRSIIVHASLYLSLKKKSELSPAVFVVTWGESSMQVSMVWSLACIMHCRHRVFLCVTNSWRHGEIKGRRRNWRGLFWLERSNQNSESWILGVASCSWVCVYVFLWREMQLCGWLAGWAVWWCLQTALL